MDSAMPSGRLSGAQGVVELLLEHHFTHAVWLVDSESSAMYKALTQAERSGLLTIVPVCREGEAIAIALGLMIGGMKPVVIIQNTGFFESGDSVRGLAIDLGMPLLLLIGYRGWKGDRSDMTDSAALYLEPVLHAYGIPSELMTGSNYTTVIPEAAAEAERRSGPVAVLIQGQWQD